MGINWSFRGMGYLMGFAANTMITMIFVDFDGFSV